jgi:hypothetical protein
MGFSCACDESSCLAAGVTLVYAMRYAAGALRALGFPMIDPKKTYRRITPFRERDPTGWLALVLVFFALSGRDHGELQVCRS